MSVASVITPQPVSELRSAVEAYSRQKISHCYQCGKCTAGCPVAYAMDLTPRRVMRAIQLGLKDELLASRAPWICFFCITCSARCPREIDIASVMESLRLLAISEKTKSSVEDIKLFHRLFLSFVRLWGRAYELGLGAAYNLLGRHPLNKAEIIPGMLSRGKLAFLPHRSKRANEIRKIFKRIEVMRNEKIIQPKSEVKAQ